MCPVRWEFGYSSIMIQAFSYLAGHRNKFVEPGDGLRGLEARSLVGTSRCIDDFARCGVGDKHSGGIRFLFSPKGV